MYVCTMVYISALLGSDRGTNVTCLKHRCLDVIILVLQLMSQPRYSIRLAFRQSGAQGLM